MRGFIIVFSTFLSLSLFSQSLEGKWLVIRDDSAFDTNWIPNIEVLEFTEKELSIWSYDSIQPFLQKANKSYSLSKGSLSMEIEENELVKCPVRFLNNDILKVDYILQFENKNLSLPVTYVKLLKTKLGVDLDTENNLVFKSEIGNIKLRFDLKEYLENYSEEELSYENVYFIEKIDHSLILSLFVGRVRRGAFLIHTHK